LAAEIEEPHSLPTEKISVFAPTQGPTAESVLESALMEMVRKRTLPEPAIRMEVCNYGRAKSAELLLSEEYDEAAAVDLAVDIIIVNIKENESAEASKSQTAALRARLERCQAEGREIATAGDAALERRREEARKRLEELKKWHEIENEELEKEWASPAALIRFSKPSPELLQVRRKQKGYALLRDFENAKEMKLQAMEMEAKECGEATRRFIAAFENARQQLLERQQRELECLVAKSELKITCVEGETEKEIEANERIQKSIAWKIAEPKRQKKPVIRVPIVRKLEGSTGIITQTDLKEMLLGFRKSPYLGRLNLPEFQMTKPQSNRHPQPPTM
jgi:hypothetical protein